MALPQLALAVMSPCGGVYTTTVMLPLSELKRNRPGPDPRLHCCGVHRTLAVSVACGDTFFPYAGIIPLFLLLWSLLYKSFCQILKMFHLVFSFKSDAIFSDLVISPLSLRQMHDWAWGEGSWLGALAVYAESLNSVHSGHIGRLTSAYCNSTFPRSDACGLCGHMVYTDIDTYT